MNKKGFTLIEMLGVIVILSVVTLIAVPAVIRVSKSIKENMYCTKIGQIEQAATMYAEENQINLDENCSVGSSTLLCQHVTIGTIATSNYISRDKKVNYVIDPRDNSNMESTSVVIYKKNNRYTSTISGICGNSTASYALTLTVVANGGIWSGQNSMPVSEGEEITLATPTNANYEFVGWRRSDNNELITTASFIVPSTSITLTAEWNFIGYELRIITDGGIWDGTTPQTKNANDLVTLNEPTKAGHIFVGWKRSDNDEVVTSFNMPNNDLTLTAEWTFESTSFAYIAPTTAVPSPYTLWEAPADGWYQIEAWGAQGGSNEGQEGTTNGNVGGLGGYTSGKIELTAGEKLYIYVGGQGSYASELNQISTKGYNGGGMAGYETTCGTVCMKGGAGGGGATDIRYFITIPETSNLMVADTLGLKSRILVSGGGGGVSNWREPKTGGVGGGLIAGSGNMNSTMTTTYVDATGGTQTAGGDAAIAPYTGTNGSFGLGGNSYSNYGGGGGGGYYGGGGGGSMSEGATGSGAGGSSFISGYAGVNAIKSDGTHSDNTRHYSGKYFIDGEMQSGVNEGNGKAKITYLGMNGPARINPKLNNAQYIKDCGTGNANDGYVYWNEIQAIDENGLNVAYGKDIIDYTVSEHSSYPYSKITNGIIGNSLVGGATSNNSQGTNRCVTVDLGNTYNLNEIGIWHIENELYPTYQPNYNTYTEVSSDNTNWTTVFPMASELETSIGKRISAYSN